MGEVTVAQLKSGEITVSGKKVLTAGLSSYARAKEIALILKTWIEAGTFLLTEPVAPLPAFDYRILVQAPQGTALGGFAPGDLKTLSG